MSDITKLTLSIDKKIVKQGKLLAKQQGRSLSAIVSSYLESLTASHHIDDIDPQISALIGIGKGPYDESDYRRYLEEKYS
ncbi:hypothetical protein KIM372_12790 [Bombiscardovia nodaiensis]|uniref:Antitoxin n=1 Tax=Bombiscardovia nodaiensis TaxID=2932181 RepID=A0ABN6SE22_9BIFI|nr:hypothetical protein KIM372_12790 [Bombiscardovia nodaiensis]